jgi:hypothetical protein
MNVAYKDDLVCILKPESKRGILVFSGYKNPKNVQICNVGLKSGKQLHNEGVNFGRSIHHPYIFFRAPFKYDGHVNHTSFESEIKSLYGSGLNLENKVFIRVDPDKTFVFSSEIRAKFQGNLNRLNKSKIKLSEYLKIIKDNNVYMKNVILNNGPTSRFKWNMFTYKVKQNYRGRPTNSNEINFNIARNSEILVSLPHLEPKYFVKCF